MIKPILSRVYWWAHAITERQRLRKRLAELQRRLETHDMDMASMAHFPASVQERMQEHRYKLMEQIETVKRLI